MRTFDVQSVQLDVPFGRAFDYISDPRRLPEWTHAFKIVEGEHATMTTSAGTLQVGLRVTASEEHGTIDWIIRFPTGETVTAASRLIPMGDKSLFTFILQAPPVPLEQLEGALDEQSRVLTIELATLRRQLHD